jgi:hypothetical protein
VSLVAADGTPKHGSPSAPDSCVLVWAARRHGERNYNFPQLMRLTGTPADVERGAQLVYDLLGQHKDLAHNVVEVSDSSCQFTPSILDAVVSPYHPRLRTIEHPASHATVMRRVPPSGRTPQGSG